VAVTADPELRFVLHQARPNPFASGTRIAFDTAQPGPVRVVVYDVRGRLVTTLLDQSLSAGSHTVQWEGRDAAGRTVASGAYFCRLSSPEGVRVLQLVRFSP
jgi:flagellar hook assembly protein FlgD